MWMCDSYIHFLLFWSYVWWLVGLFFSWLPVVFFFVCFLFACVLLVCLFVNWGVAFLLSFFQASNRRARLLTWVFGWIPGVTGIPESPSTWKMKSWRGKDFHNFFFASFNRKTSIQTSQCKMCFPKNLHYFRKPRFYFRHDWFTCIKFCTAASFWVLIL